LFGVWWQWQNWWFQRLTVTGDNCEVCVEIYSALVANIMFDGNFDTTSYCVNLGFFLGYYEIISDLCVANFESWYYNFKFPECFYAKNVNVNRVFNLI